jgi:excisionase family DNA binding protein
LANADSTAACGGDAIQPRLVQTRLGVPLAINDMAISFSVGYTSAMTQRATRKTRTEKPNCLPDVLTLPEAAAYLRISESKVEQLVREQGLPARRVDNEWRILKAALHDWLRSPLIEKEKLIELAGAWKEDPYAPFDCVDGRSAFP